MDQFSGGTPINEIDAVYLRHKSDGFKAIRDRLLIALDILLEKEEVTAAAQRIGITQPAMSAQLARLRALFSDPLLAASGRKLLPTARAIEIKEPLRILLADLDLLVRETAQFDPSTTERAFRLIGTDYVHAVMSSHLSLAQSGAFRRSSRRAVSL